MEDFVAASREFTGSLSIRAPVKAAFERFSPVGERTWVPDWNPELLYPPDVAWGRGQIFRTQEEAGEAIWIVTDLNHDAYLVEYHRLEPHRYVARVRVKCIASSDGSTDVVTTYTFVGLSKAGNDEIAAMTAAAYTEKMKRWQRWIGADFHKGG